MIVPAPLVGHLMIVPAPLVGHADYAAKRRDLRACRSKKARNQLSAVKRGDVGTQIK